MVEEDPKTDNIYIYLFYGPGVVPLASVRCGAQITIYKILPKTGRRKRAFKSYATMAGIIKNFYGAEN